MFNMDKYAASLLACAIVAGALLWASITREALKRRDCPAAAFGGCISGGCVLIIIVGICEFLN